MNLIALPEQGEVELVQGQAIDVCVDTTNLITGIFEFSDRRSITVSHSIAKQAFQNGTIDPRWKKKTIRIALDEIRYINTRD